ncbi:GerAB/ArcD/ProY family transporter [Virgibacillus ihumii]|uniref:GerAB/ArcD/ProY family transporter n=1 Tax=Virgibacillus ihumii TaxID=2686091 RepID=UPI00157C32B2|nr:endospore germination permease [Virgibacillus ihumii]
MKRFEYGDDKISSSDIMAAVPSYIISIVVLTLPGDLASVTIASDGWISLLIAGVISVIVMWLLAKIVIGFPNQSFFTYTSTILSGPVKIVILFLFAVIWICVSAFEVRSIAIVTKQYMFDRTPLEVIALSFLLVVVYAVSGSRAGIFRLNKLFLPIILFIAFFVFVLNLGYFKTSQLLPLFQTDMQGYLKGIKVSMLSYVGFIIVLFYTGLVDNPNKTPKMVAIGMCIPVVLYIMIFILSIGVFGHAVTSELRYPTIELAKNVEIPGDIFTRFELLFFLIWTMAIFNTTTMALDIAVLSLNSIFKHTKKTKIIFILAPIVFSIGMIPQNVLELESYAAILFKISLIYSLVIPFLLLLVGKLKGSKSG